MTRGVDLHSLFTNHDGNAFLIERVRQITRFGSKYRERLAIRSKHPDKLAKYVNMSQDVCVCGKNKRFDEHSLSKTTPTPLKCARFNSIRANCKSWEKCDVEGVEIGSADVQLFRDNHHTNHSSLPKFHTKMSTYFLSETKHERCTNWFDHRTHASSSIHFRRGSPSS